MDKKSIGVSLIINGFILLLISLLFAVPNLATEDLSNEDYITVAYGRHLEADYIYKNNNVYWKQFNRDTYEADGYYNVLSTGNPEIFPKCSLKSSAKGTIHLCWMGKKDGTEECKTTGYYNTVNVYQLTDAYIDLVSDNLESGIYYYWFEIAFDEGGVAKSFPYRFYVEPEGRWEKKRLIALTTTENLTDGFFEINLTNEILEGFDSSNIIYDTDGSEVTLSGTVSRLLFTNTDKTKAYAYYIDKHKGGYYSFNNNTENYTTIKIFIDENLTEKSIIMYFNYKTEAYNPHEGYYDFGGRRTDFNNNPFNIHQVFSDWRWTETFCDNNILNVTESGGSSIYSRGNCRSSTTNVGGWTKFLPFKNQGLTKLGFKAGVNIYIYSMSPPSEFIIYIQNETTKLFVIHSMPHPNRRKILYNSSQNSTSTDSTSDIEATIQLLNNNLSCIGNVNLNIPEANNYFNITMFYIGSGSRYNRPAYLYYFYNKIDISADYTIYSSTKTSAETQFTEMETTQNEILNEYKIEGKIKPTEAGTLSCFDETTGTFLNSKTITESMIDKTISFEMSGFITNETYFLNLNSTLVFCQFKDINDVLAKETEKLNQTFSNTTRLFINHTKPINKKQLDNGTTEIPFETQFKFYNYTANQTYDIYYIYTGKNANENILFTYATGYRQYNLTDDYNFTETINLYEDVNFTGNTYARVDWYYRLYAFNDYSGNGTFQTSDTGYRYYDIGARPEEEEEINEQTDWINIYDNDDYEPYGNFVLVGGYVETQDIELTSDLYCYDWTNNKMIFTHELGRESSETGDVQQVQDLGNNKYAIAFTYVYDGLNISESEFKYYCCIYTTRDNLFCSDVATYDLPTDKLIITDRKPTEEQYFFTNDINIKATFTPTFDTYSNYSFLVVVGTENMDMQSYFNYLPKRLNETNITFLQYMWKLIINDTYSNEDFMKDTGVIYSWIGNSNNTYYFDEDYTDVCSEQECLRQYIIFYWFNNQTVSAVPVWKYYINYKGGTAGYIFIPDVRTYVTANLTDEETKSLFWGNPLSFFSSFVYVNFVAPNNDETVSGIFYWVFMIFWNFYLILLLIFIMIYQKTTNLMVAILSILPFTILFSYLSWFSIPVTLIIIMLIAGIVLKLRSG